MVGDDVVDEVAAHGAWVAEVADLDGRAAGGEDAWAAVHGEAFEVDGDVDAGLAGELCDLGVAHE